MGYLERQKQSGLKIGDKVLLLRKAETHENGWNNSWEPEMDRLIGKVGTIIGIEGYSGIVVEFKNSNPYEYPYFVLERVPEIAKRTTKWSRTRAGLKVPAYLVCFMGMHHRTVIISAWTYGRNGDAHVAEGALRDAREEAEKWPDISPWIERGWITVRLPRKRIE